MKLIVEKSSLNGSIAIPASKSHTIRAVAIASLGRGKSKIKNPLISGDTLSAAQCYRALGAEIDTSDDKVWIVTGTAGIISADAEIIDVGNSGTTLRIALGSAALAAGEKPIIFTGDEQIQSRPLTPLLDSLNQLGANCKSLKNNGKAPVLVAGQLTGGKTSIECTTSQYLSSLLLAAPLAKNDTEIDVILLNEPDYVQMTVDWLDRQGIEYKNDRMQKFIIKGGQSYTAFKASVPADFSSATFFLCAAAITPGSDLTLTELDFSDSQPDKAVVDYLKNMGADISIEENSVRVRYSNLTGTEIDMNKTPDTLPAMAVAAAFAQGQTRLVNVPQARLKETDRIRCMAEELKKLSVNVEELPDGIIINGSKPVAAELDGRSDHRIVMALAVAAMAIDESCTIETAEAVNVTFPNFVELMNAGGANMKIV